MRRYVCRIAGMHLQNALNLHLYGWVLQMKTCGGDARILDLALEHGEGGTRAEVLPMERVNG